MHASILIATLVAVSQAAPATPVWHDNDRCHGAPNCETYIHPKTGLEMIRFKAGMGPGSEWYNKNILPYDDFGDNGTTIVTRDDGEQEKKGRRTDLSLAKRRIAYGEIKPEKMVNILKSKCYETSCDIMTFSVETGYIEPDGSLIEAGALQFTPTGQYNQNVRGYYFKALHEMAAGRFKHRVETIATDYGTITKDYDQYESSGYYNIQRHSGGGLSGFLSVDLAFKDLEADICKEVFSYLSGLLAPAGGVGAIGSSFFGVGGDPICDATA